MLLAHVKPTLYVDLISYFPHFLSIDFRSYTNINPICLLTHVSNVRENVQNHRFFQRKIEKDALLYISLTSPPTKGEDGNRRHITGTWL